MRMPRGNVFSRISSCVCLSVILQLLTALTYKVHICYAAACTSSEYLAHIRTLSSSAQGQGHRGKSVSMLPVCGWSAAFD